jgi:hypothetical protein
MSGVKSIHPRLLSGSSSSPYAPFVSGSLAACVWHRELCSIRPELFVPNFRSCKTTIRSVLTLAREGPEEKRESGVVALQNGGLAIADSSRTNSQTIPCIKTKLGNPVEDYIREITGFPSCSLSHPGVEEGRRLGAVPSLLCKH